MHAKPDLRVVLEWMIARSGSVITDVIALTGNLEERVNSKSIHIVLKRLCRTLDLGPQFCRQIA